MGSSAKGSGAALAATMCGSSEAAEGLGFSLCWPRLAVDAGAMASTVDAGPECPHPDLDAQLADFDGTGGHSVRCGCRGHAVPRRQGSGGPRDRKSVV